MGAKHWMVAGAVVAVLGQGGAARAQSCGGGGGRSSAGGGGGAVAAPSSGSGTTIFDVLGHVVDAVVDGIAHPAPAVTVGSAHASSLPPPPRPALPPLSSHFFDGVPEAPPCPCAEDPAPTEPMLGSFPIEFAATTGVDSVDAGTLRWSGWANHPSLSEQVDGQTEAPGTRLGLGRATLVGGSLRVNTVVGSWLVLGLEGGYVRQAGSNPGSVAVDGFRAGPIQSWRVGASAGPRVQGGPLTFRATLFVGYDYTWARFVADGTVACDAPPEIRAGRFVVRPRVQLDVELGSYLSVGLYADADALHLGDAGGGVALSLHSDRFSGRPPPEVPAPPP